MSEITLDDILKAPTDNDALARHLFANGYVQPPPPPPEPTPTIAPATVQPMQPYTPKSEIAEMRTPTIPMTTGTDIEAPSTRELEGLGSAPIGGTPFSALAKPSLGPIMPKQEIGLNLAEQGTPNTPHHSDGTAACADKTRIHRAGKYEYKLIDRR